MIYPDQSFLESLKFCIQGKSCSGGPGSFPVPWKISMNPESGYLFSPASEVRRPMELGWTQLGRSHGNGDQTADPMQHQQEIRFIV